jgi:cytochrome P450
MRDRAQVRDWMTDWDHLDPDWIEDPFPIWDAIRSSHCPIAHTERFLGAYLPTRYADIRDIAYDPEHFSSRQVVVRDNPPPVSGGGAPPITSDPPRHRAARMVLLPPFAPNAIEKLVPKARAICNELIDGFIDEKRCDVAVRYAQHIPVRVIAHMLGIPDGDGDRFRKWIHEIIEIGTTDEGVLQRALEEITEYFAGHLQARRTKLGDDLISYLSNAKYPDGQPFKENHVLGSLRLLLVAGIDTTWSAIGAAIWHLAKFPADRRRLVEEPALLPTAIEELLRAYAPVTMARVVAKEKTINGCTFKEGQMVLLSFPAANRDPAMFPDADKVVIDRRENRHAAFGLGIHRCVGSNLARMEMTVAVEEFLKRIPDFCLAGKTKWSAGAIRGPRELPIAVGPSPN